MKMVKPNYNQYKASTPANKVFKRYLIILGYNVDKYLDKKSSPFILLQAQFIVSSAMTKHDVKNYLEKIYQVN